MASLKRVLHNANPVVVCSNLRSPITYDTVWYCMVAIHDVSNTYCSISGTNVHQFI